VGVLDGVRPPVNAVATGQSRRPLDELFAALADPTRRDLLQQLVHDGPRTATEFAAGSALTRQAIVKHLKALEATDLVVAERTGREVKYRATTERLADAVRWLLDASESWDRRASRLVSGRQSRNRLGVNFRDR